MGGKIQGAVVSRAPILTAAGNHATHDTGLGDFVLRVFETRCFCDSIRLLDGFRFSHADDG